MRELRGPSRTWGLAVVVPLALGLTACGEEEVGAKPELPTESPALWNPCDVLDAAFISKQFGTDAVEEAGTDANPECRFTPSDDGSGEAALTSSYLLFSGTLAEAWETMGVSEDAEVTSPAIDGADDARVVVNATADQLYVTGFVQTGSLIQQVDVVDPKPYDEAQVVAGVEATLTRLSRHAVASGVKEKESEGANEAARDSATDEAG